ncbi:MAG: hypothetical protein HY291_17880 [Planctomycetes bacterium]|nr:hypothetical protein [Planctomycetota bacterium]
MNRPWSLVLLLLSAACSAARSQGADGGTLAERVRQASADVRDLEALYRSAEQVSERASALELILQRAAWLEQAGGMKDARADQLLALARLEGFQRTTSLRCGYLANASGASIVELTARRPKPGELPEKLRAFEKRVLFLNVLNASSGALEISGGIAVDLHARFGETRREQAKQGAELPEDLQPLAPLFALPERLAAGEEKQCLVLLPDAAEPLEAVSIRAKEESQAADMARSARVHFPEGADPDGFAAARKKAAAIEKDILAEREAQLAEAAKTPKPAPEKPKPDPAKPAPEKPKPEEKIPDGIGTVERAGAGELIQIRMNAGAVFFKDETLRVRKDNIWVGKVKIPDGVGFVEDKQVYWVKIVEGERDALANGTLHHPE